MSLSMMVMMVLVNCLMHDGSGQPPFPLAPTDTSFWTFPTHPSLVLRELSLANMLMHFGPADPRVARWMVVDWWLWPMISEQLSHVMIPDGFSLVWPICVMDLKYRKSRLPRTA